MRGSKPHHLIYYFYTIFRNIGFLSCYYKILHQFAIGKFFPKFIQDKSRRNKISLFFIFNRLICDSRRKNIFLVLQFVKFIYDSRRNNISLTLHFFQFFPKSFFIVNMPFNYISFGQHFTNRFYCQVVILVKNS